MITPEHVRTTFRWLVNAGIDAPPRYIGPDGEATIRAVVDVHASILSRLMVTPDELEEARLAYVLRPVNHGGRRAFPDVGMLVDAVREVRAAKIPPFGQVEKEIRITISRHTADPSRGWDVSRLPEVARETAVRALVDARVAHRLMESPEYMMRDLAAAYESIRKGGGAR